jgi:hypothetical protein
MAILLPSALVSIIADRLSSYLSAPHELFISRKLGSAEALTLQ